MVASGDAAAPPERRRSGTETPRLPDRFSISVKFGVAESPGQIGQWHRAETRYRNTPMSWAFRRDG
jgi:hypothetical protein